MVRLINMDEIYRQNADLIYRYLFSLCQEAEMAEEVTQQTFYEAIRTAGSYRGEAKVSTFLCGIAKNLLKKELCRRRIQATVPLDEAMVGTAGGTEDTVIHELEKRDLFLKIRRLSQQAAQVVLLRISGELSFREIGEILNRSEVWARVTFYRARQSLMKGDEA